MDFNYYNIEKILLKKICPAVYKNKMKVLKSLKKFYNISYVNMLYQKEVNRCLFCKNPVNIDIFNKKILKIKKNKNNSEKNISYQYLSSFSLETYYFYNNKYLNENRRLNPFTYICHSCFIKDNNLYHCCCDLIQDRRLNPINYRYWKYKQGKYYYGCNDS